MPASAQEAIPRIIQIYQDRLKPSREPAYQAIEEDARRVCARFKCPNPYLAIASITGPSQVWFLNGYDSAETMEKVGGEYGSNPDLLGELARVAAPKADLVFVPRTILARYRDDLSRGTVGINPYTRYLSIRTISVRPGHLQDFAEIQKTSRGGNRLFYQAFSGMPDGTFFVITPMRMLRESVGDIEQPGTRDLISATIASSEALLFALSPPMSYPTKEWIAADSDFWTPKP